GQVFRRLEFLKPELREAEHLIVHALDHLAEAVDFQSDVALVLIEARIGRGRRLRWGLLRKRRHREQGNERRNKKSVCTHAEVLRYWSAAFRIPVMLRKLPSEHSYSLMESDVVRSGDSAVHGYD